MTFLELNSDYKYSVDAANTTYIALYLKPLETYTQYIFIGETKIADVKLFASGKEVPNIAFETVITGSGYMILTFVITKDFKSQCLQIEVNGSKTNPFNASYYDLEQTTLVTYWHSEDIYDFPFRENNFKPCQIRLPIYYNGSTTEESSEEYVTNFRLEENIGRSRVKRVFKTQWLVDGNDWLNKRLAKVSDLDYVYLDGVRHITDPFTYDIAGPDGFVLSEWETQEREKDVIEIGISGAIVVEKQTIDVFYNSTMDEYCVTDFWFGYFHSFDIPKEDTFVNITDENNNIIGIYSYEDIMNCVIPVDLIGVNGQFSNIYGYYITDLAGNKSNFTTLQINFIEEGFRYYDPAYYNEQNYA